MNTCNSYYNYACSEINDESWLKNTALACEVFVFLCV